MALKRIVSLTLARTGKVEISAPLAVYYIMKESSMISSHEYSTLPLYSFIKKIDEETDFGHRIEKTDQETYSPVPATTDYIYRPQEMGDTCLYEFYMYFKICNGSIKTRNEKPQHIEEIIEHGNVEKFRFLDTHPLYAKKHVSRRKKSYS